MLPPLLNFHYDINSKMNDPFRRDKNLYDQFFPSYGFLTSKIFGGVKIYMPFLISTFEKPYLGQGPIIF